MERKNINLLRCTEENISYVMGLKNFTHEEVQDFGCIRTERDKRICIFALDEEGMKKALSNKDYFLIIAVSEENIMGFIFAFGFGKNVTDITKNKLLINDMAVLKEYKESDVGTLLIEKLKECSSQNGYEQLFASTWRDDIPEINLYVKTGAKKFHGQALSAMMQNHDEIEKKINEYEDVEKEIEEHKDEDKYKKVPISFRWQVSL